jgi:hypothetical protein
MPKNINNNLKEIKRIIALICSGTENRRKLIGLRVGNFTIIEKRNSDGQQKE